MLKILSLPDSIERPDYRIELVGGALPHFEGGELVELVWNAALGEKTIRRLTLAQPASGMVYPIFRDTEGNSTIEGLGKTTVVFREWYGQTDMYENALAGSADGTLLTASGDVNNLGVWAVAGAGDIVFGRLARGSALTPANGGIITVERVSSYILP